MVKRHLKSLNTPKTWDVARKENVFVTRPQPGAHPFSLGISINHILKKDLKIATITKDTQLIINNKDCLVNSKPVKNIHHLVGFMDVITLPKLKKNYRVILNPRGKIGVIEIDEKEANLVLSKVMNKTKIKKGLTQINTLNNRNIPVKEDKYKTSDSLLVELPSQKIKKQLSLSEGSYVILIGGKHIGSLGLIQKIEGNKVFFKSETADQIYETLKKFVFVLGKDKAEIKVQ